MTMCSNRPLDAGGADIVLAQHFQHGRAGHPHGHRRIAVADGERGQDHDRQVAQRIIPQRDIVDRRHPGRAEHEMRDLQHHQDRHDAEPERRRGDARDRHRAHDMIEPAVLVQCRDRAQRDGDQHRHQGRQQGDLQRHRNARDDLFADRLARPHRRAEIAPREARDEVEELQQQRAVEAELGVAVGDRRRVDRAARAQPHHADVAGNKAHQDEHQGRRPDQGRDRQQQAVQDVAIHRRAPALALPYLSSQILARLRLR